ncbi:hypothetical protein KB20921_33240 [Edwardsiella ictaluri]|nr:hypothetical protein KH20906_33140 [Edwardsiella ictaluri]BEI04063.1 hypothetical protein KB20921_33240 [Edwardsiella ictaluri]BEI07518.1 hypothetical protein KH201010_33040 [Edwardsiella ictaluri]BEI10990.1 hypothetical protein STU22726_33210 [Edwardsiella ictaluri]BEI14469.1 hypothetical protein STU22816_33220 [Edwardsiella ictaluri]
MAWDGISGVTVLIYRVNWCQTGVPYAMFPTEPDCLTGDTGVEYASEVRVCIGESAQRYDLVTQLLDRLMMILK